MTLPNPITTDVLQGNLWWSAAQSPLLFTHDVVLAVGATLTVAPSVDILLEAGVSFRIAGTLLVQGEANQPVRFRGAMPGRWALLEGEPGSTIVLEHAEIRGGGAAGTVLASTRGALVLQHTEITDDGGQIQIADSTVAIQESEIAGNDIPHGAPLELTYQTGGHVTLMGNRIGGNRVLSGTAQVQISNQSPSDALVLTMQGNLIRGPDGPNLLLVTNGPLVGGLGCNTLAGGPVGLSVRGRVPQVPALPLQIRANAFEAHTPPLALYRRIGIGRGAISVAALDMQANWWNSGTGPYQPEQNPFGGEAVGINIAFTPWLRVRPPCAPLS